MRIATQFGEQYGYKRARQGAIAVAATWVLVLTAFNQQPQLQAFRLLEQPVQTQAQRQELLQQSDRIRKGLVHAHLSSHRYVTSTGTESPYSSPISKKLWLARIPVRVAARGLPHLDVSFCVSRLVSGRH
ncbi:MAG: hypothetical protein HC925_04555 [Coleofasciculaceae cyanobacterium SM2_3_26]|nr:hypothetical protein [Coleofasciculaceae cyanobacterium SM2_3_26]